MRCATTSQQFIVACKPAFTDEDSGEEDITTIHNLPGKQLIAPAEVSQTSIGLGSISDEPHSSRPTDIDCEVDEPPEKQTRLDPGPSQKNVHASTRGKTNAKKITKTTYDWCDVDLKPNETSWSKRYDVYNDLSPMEQFFFTIQ
ncbi:hypothetical protein J6590_100383 [Homalodisca vitripennis]|nr:hypothetical protein J6590_100383 [Homalodisca vitripennis]